MSLKYINVFLCIICWFMLYKMSMGEQQQVGQNRFFFNLPWISKPAWFQFPWLIRPQIPAAITTTTTSNPNTIPICIPTIAATTPCTCSSTEICSIGQYCTSTTTSSTCSTIIPPCSSTTTPTIDTCECGSTTCQTGQTCTSSPTSSTCSPVLCSLFVESGTCLCGSTICQENQICSESTSTCSFPGRCLTGVVTNIPCTCGTNTVIVCRATQTCGAGVIGTCT